MKNLTLRIDETVLGKARRIAAEQSSSVNALIRDYLNDLVRNEERRIKARSELLQICQRSTAVVGAKPVTREEIYDR